MFGINLKNTFLDLYPNTNLGFELNSPLWFGSDVEVLQGSFMFPITVPLSPRNEALLGYPSVIDNEKEFLTDAVCDAYVSSSNILRGKLSVTDVRHNRQKEATLQLTITASQVLKDTVLSDFFKSDTQIFGGGGTDTRYLAYQTCLYPKLFPFIFHPVKNEEFNPEKAADYEGAKWQNPHFGEPWWTPYCAVTPFMRLDYVLAEVFRKAGYYFDNQFQTTHELELITLYNNRNLLNWKNDLEFDAVPDVKLHYHLPNIKTGEFLKNTLRTYNQGIFINNFENHTEISPAENILKTDKVIDWTSKLLSDISITEERDLIRRFDFEENTDNLPLFKKTTDVKGDREFKAKYMPTPSVLSAKMPVNHQAQTPVSAASAKGAGSMLYFDATQNNDYTPHMMLYRGFTYSSIELENTADNTFFTYNSAPYPIAAVEDTDANGKTVRIGWNNDVTPDPTTNPTPATDAQYTLTWQGDKGIFAKWWQQWLTFLQSKRALKVRLLLSPRDIQQFDFKTKIRIQNRIYLVKRLKINANRNGLQPTEAELYATI